MTASIQLPKALSLVRRHSDRAPREGTGAVRERGQPHAPANAAVEQARLPAIAKSLGYSVSVLERLARNRPALFSKLARAAASGNSRDLQACKPVMLYRGIAVLPEQYSPIFAKNFYCTTAGNTWFSRDLVKAYDYSTPQAFSKLKSFKEVRDAGHKHFGIVLEVQMPTNSLADARALRRKEDVVVRRSALGNESDFISAVYVTRVDGRGFPSQVRYSYDEFKAKFGGSNSGLS